MTFVPLMIQEAYGNVNGFMVVFMMIFWKVFHKFYSDCVASVIVI